MTSVLKFQETIEVLGAREPQDQAERETVAHGETVPSSSGSHLGPYPLCLSPCHCKFCQMSHSPPPPKMHLLGVWKLSIPIDAENENLTVAKFGSNGAHHCDSI